MKNRTGARLCATIPLLAITGTALLATAMPASADVDGSSAVEGIAIQTDTPNPLWTAKTERLFTDQKTTGANAVTIAFTLEQDTATSTSIHRRVKNPKIVRSYTPSDSELVSGIHAAQRQGLKVTLKPQIEMATGGWRAHITFGKKQNKEADAWAKSWRTWMVHYTELAAKTGGVDSIVIGTENYGVSLNRYNAGNSARWIKTVAAIRAADKKVRPKGQAAIKVTYAAYNTGRNTRPNETMLLDRKFVKTLDYLGMTYYPLRDVSNPTLARLKAHMELERKGVFTPLKKRYGKPIVVIEIGFKGPDHALQARQLEAAYGFLDSVSNVKGVFYYRSLNDPAAGGPGDESFTVQHKPAEKVLAKWYGGKVPR